MRPDGGGDSAGAGGTGERVAREPLTGRVARRPNATLGSGPVGERATPTPGQDPRPSGLRFSRPCL
jgi:hypothetical protein